jgi:hypothetical protein
VAGTDALLRNGNPKESCVPFRRVKPVGHRSSDFTARLCARSIPGTDNSSLHPRPHGYHRGCRSPVRNSRRKETGSPPGQCNGIPAHSPTSESPRPRSRRRCSNSDSKCSNKEYFAKHSAHPSRRCARRQCSRLQPRQPVFSAVGRRGKINALRPQRRNARAPQRVKCALCIGS